MSLVAIVGRPNVGKSTLFNRVIRERRAIVEEQPGITRDRIYGTAEWNGLTFDLVDTGGIVPDSDELFDTAIREQATIAIEEAHVIIFLVDGRDGITPVDDKIATMLRKAGKPIALVVNKCDNAATDLHANEFYRLGLGDPFPISALAGRSTGDFLDYVVQNLSGSVEQDDSRLKIAIVGRPNVGKSSLSNALAGKERSIVTPIAGTTRDAIDTVVKYYGEEIVLIDTAGLRRRSQIKEQVELYGIVRTARAIDRSDVAVVVLDAQRGIEAQDKRIIGQVVEARKGIIIAINKWDLVEKDTRTAEGFTVKIREAIPNMEWIPVVYISALSHQRITKILTMAKDIQERRLVRTPTHVLNDMFIPILERTPPPSVRGRDLRINYVTQVKTAPPVFAFFSNHPELIPEAYKRYMERALREQLLLEGIPVSFIFRRKNEAR